VAVEDRFEPGRHHLAAAFPAYDATHFADTAFMARIFALFLACTLLFQMSWAVAAAYCEHETSPKAAMHFGHHVHVHKSVDGEKNAASKLAVDDDCSLCHAGHAAIIPVAWTDVPAVEAASASFPQPFMHGSAPARAPDRPQWLRLA
jgi:hypothetical protein